jgi:hypothetical protein
MCLECFEKAALEAMQAYAANLGITGVAGILVIKKGANLDDPLVPKLLTCERFYRAPQRDRGAEDTGTNYLAIVLSKIAQMVRTGLDSGYCGNYHGEHDYKGGMIRYLKNLIVMTAFSGATEEDDLDIAKAGFIAFEDACNEYLKAKDELLEELSRALEEF